MNIKLITIGMLSTALLFSSCKKDEEEEVTTPKPTLSVSDTYSADGYDPATATVVTAIGELSSEMKTADPTKESETVTSAELVTIYQSGSLSLKDIASEQFNTWATGTLFPEFEKASGTGGDVFDLGTPGNTPDGGAAYKHLFSGSPVELEQLIEKGSFGGACFSYVKSNLFATPSSVSSDQLDQALVLYGSEPTFEEKGLSAKYAGKRIYTGETTYHDQISYEFRKAQSAISQGLQSDKVAAVNAITKLWEEAIAAQTIYYLSGVASDLAFTPDYSITEDYNTVADAIHGWSEGVAFLSGFYGVDGSTITDAQIVSILAKINGSMTGNYTPLTLIGDFDELAELTTGINELADAYGISVESALK